jgi:hypothetical protein
MAKNNIAGVTRSVNEDHGQHAAGDIQRCAPQAVNAIVHSAQPYNVDTVIVDGRVLKRKGKLTALAAEQVMREAAESLVAVRARAGEA